MNILISGGGTAGHINPALSIANALKRRYPDAKFLFVGAQDRMEMKRVPEAGYDIVGLQVAGFDRKRLWRNFSVIVKMVRSWLKARKIVRDFAPDIAIGVGGYASGPTLFAAQRAGVPTLLQEQNSYAGVTNKQLAPRADRICVAYTGMERFFPADKILLTGNPVRKELAECTLTKEEAKARLGFDPKKPLVVSVGGSLGAQVVNEALFASVDAILGSGAQLLWQSGQRYYSRFKALADERGLDVDNGPVKLREYLTDMATVYRAADLMVSRAGASTISELQMLGIAAILIPSKNVAEDHQRKNAMALVNEDAAEMILDDDAIAKLPAAITALLTDAPRRERYAKNVRAMAHLGSDDLIADEAVKLMQNKSNKA